MDQSTLSKIVFGVLLGIAMFLSFKIIQPYFSFIGMAVILSFLFKPAYRFLLRKLKNKPVASSTAVVIIFCIFVIPSLAVLTGLMVQASTAYRSLKDANAVQRLSEIISEATDSTIELTKYTNDALLEVKNYVIRSVPDMLGSVAHLLLGLFIMGFVMYYLFKQGDEIYAAVKEHFPLKAEYKEKLFKKFENVTNGVLYGQIVSAIVQGTIAGIGFFIFRIPNPIFWGFIMILLAILPIIGAPLIWVPASIFEIIQGRYVPGIGLFLYGTLIVSNIDNIIKPKLISKKTDIHPVVVLVGVLGGLYVFGFIGMFIGPLILEILIMLLKAYSIDFEKEFKKNDDSHQEKQKITAIKNPKLQNQNAKKKKRSGSKKR